MATQTRRAPQDKKPTQAEIKAALQKSFDEVEGHEHIVPLGKIKGSDQMRIIGRITKLGIGEDSTDDIDFDGFADLVDWLGERFTVDQKAFEDWSSGEGGLGRTLKLTMALLSELGKGMGSAAS